MYLGEILACDTDVVYETMEKLLSQIIERKPLHEYSMEKEEIIAFAENVEETQQRILN